jgi:hypothetical protein
VLTEAAPITGVLAFSTPYSLSMPFWNSGSTTTLAAGGAYTTEMQTATTYTTGAAAWIDWNMDNNFSANEAIVFGVTGASLPWFTKTFAVPCTAILGVTRLG